VPQEIFQSGPNAAPTAFTVAPKQVVQPASVFAVFDGTAAAGNFLPCVTIRSKTGDVLSRTFPQGVTLAPGDVADVTYAPFLDRGAAAAAPVVASATAVIFGLAVAGLGGGVPQFCGFGATAQITPTVTGRVLAHFGGRALSTGGVNSMFFFLQQGTGVPPAPLAPAAGASIGTQTGPFAAQALGEPFTLHGVVTGLTVGVTAWFDVRANVVGTASVLNGGMVLAEV